MTEKNQNIEKATLARPMALTAKAVIFNQKGEILLLKRIEKDINGGKWDLPGGGVGEGEEIVLALKREILEESGIDVEMGPILRISEFFRQNGEILEEKRGVRYLAFAQDDSVKLSDEHSEFVWLKPEEALKKFSDKDGFEQEKKETILKALEFLEKEKALAGWKRALADLENFKIRSKKSNEEFRKYCLEDLFLELIPVLDNFDSAWKHFPEDKKKDNLAIGFFHIKNQLQKVLEEKGLQEMKVVVGEKFDENKHEALKAGIEKNSQGKIKAVLKKGYLFLDKVIRPAGVEVN